MRFPKVVAALVAVAASPAFAAGWVDKDVRSTATPSAPTDVAEMTKPDGGSSMPMGVTGYRAPTTGELAAQVASWEGKKQRRATKVMLDVGVWEAPAPVRVSLEVRQDTDRRGAKGLVEEIFEHEHHHDMQAHVVHHSHFRGHVSHAGEGPIKDEGRRLIEIDVDHQASAGSDLWWAGRGQ